MSDHGPDPIDLHVGARIRARRKMLGVSQEALAHAIGVTFQQVQKYERGANRTSASMLVRIARALHTPAAWFFDGLPDQAAPGEDLDRADAARRMVHTPQGLELARVWTELDPPARASIFSVANAILQARLVNAAAAEQLRAAG
jgi:transcriptional regulator with XRE-family HTH domain